MKLRWFKFFKRSDDQDLHPVDQRLAKQWIKRRLLVLFPELRDDPRALEQAYQNLSLDPKYGSEEGDAGIYFRMTLPF